ncbi:MAG: hypothetical protein LBL58_04450 [Tannerellaceae bacterium]|jgi:hypothetical protein|nr:hypothetical protein [Tannerellaceae bacterium]
MNGEEKEKFARKALDAAWEGWMDSLNEKARRAAEKEKAEKKKESRLRLYGFIGLISGVLTIIGFFIYHGRAIADFFCNLIKTIKKFN